VTTEHPCTCNLCGTHLAPPIQWEALRWDGSKLTRHAYWGHATMYLCEPCIKAVAEFAEKLRIEE
jgi:hypothetical protein